LLSKHFSKERIRAFMNFLKLYIRFGNSENTLNFEKEILTDTTKETMGIEEIVLERTTQKGIERRHHDSNVTFVTRLIEDTDFDDKKISRLVSVGVEFVIKIRQQLTQL
jgi:hypothetical protein